MARNRNMQLLCVVVILIIFAYNIRNLANLDMPCIELDEFGYWTNAALFAGKDWSHITTNLCSYYGYGLGVIYSLFIRVCPDINIAYQMSILFNSVLVSSSVLLMAYICRYIYKEIDFACIPAVGLALFYPGILNNTQFSWSETLLFFFFLVNVVFLIKVVAEKRSIYSVLLAVSSIYTYMIHQRALGLVAAVIVCMLFGVWCKRITKRQFIFFMFTFIVMFLIHCTIKDYIYNHNWSNTYSSFEMGNEISAEEKKLANDYGSQANNILFCFSLNGIKCFLIGFFGKLYYMGISSFFLVFEGMRFVFGRIKKDYKNSIPEVFMLLTLFFTLGIATIFQIYPSRIDTVLYGRYTDWIIIIFIAFGIIQLLHNGIEGKILAIYALVATIYIILFHQITDSYHLSSYFPTCAPAANYYRVLCKGKLGNHWMELMHTIHCSIMIVVYVGVTILRKKKIQSICVFVLFLFFWTFEADSTIENTIYIGYKEEIKEISAEIKSYAQEKIYYLVDDKSQYNIYIGSIQFLLYENSIECVSAENAEQILEGILIYPTDISVNFEGAEEYEHFAFVVWGDVL